MNSAKHSTAKSATYPMRNNIQLTSPREIGGFYTLTMKSIEAISDEITVLEGDRDFGDITDEGMEMLAVLNLCYDLLTRTKAVQGIEVVQMEEMKEPGFDEEFAQVYGVSSNVLADFAFSIITKTGKVDLRSLLYQIKYNHTDTAISKAIGIRRATISDYMNSKSQFSADKYEQIVNYTLNE